ncbi:MAG: hypothetical protein KBT20_07575 [Bacteroidales bacterium]|nr:hypothetical protein [Candidatus Liminaster caballi]
MKKIFFPIIALLMASTSCNSFLHKELKPTAMGIKDSIRHYYPIVLCDELSITCEISNKGNEPLAITDIQPSNFAIELNSPMPSVIPPGGMEMVNFIFHSEKNVGFAEHKIRFFGNIIPNGVATLIFDTHIVRPTVDKFDYEEIYFDRKRDLLDELVDGQLGQKGYWTDGEDADSSYQRSYKKYLIY